VRTAYRGWRLGQQWLRQSSSRATVLIAERKGTWLALAAPFLLHVSHVLRRAKRRLDRPARQFSNGLGVRSGPRRQHRTHGELDFNGTREFTLGLAFGNSQHHAISTLLQSLSIPFAEHYKRYAEQWERSGACVLPLDKVSGDGGNLYRASFNLASRS